VEQRVRGLGEVLVRHRAVGGAEVHRFRQDLLLTAAGADALIVKADRGIDLLVLIEPFGVDLLREGGAGAIDQHLG
jgi:hypothetical protein